MLYDEKIVNLAAAGFPINEKNIYQTGNILVNTMALNYGSGKVVWMVEVTGDSKRGEDYFSAKLIKYSPNPYNIHRISEVSDNYIKGYWNIAK